MSATNTDFRLATGVFENEKIVKLGRRLGDAGVLAWIRLLRYTALYRPTGDLAGLDDEGIMIAGMTDLPDFVSVMCKLKLLDGDGPGGYSVHDWLDWNPWAAGAEARSAAASVAANARWAKVNAERTEAQSEIMPAAMPDDAERMRSASTRNAPSPNPIPIPNPSPIPIPSPSPRESPPEVPPEGGAPLISAAAVVSEMYDGGRRFPAKEPPGDRQPTHLLWAVEMVNGAIFPRGIAVREAKAGGEMLEAGYSETEIVAQYRHQRSIKPGGYSLHRLREDIPSLHGRAVDGIRGSPGAPGQGPAAAVVAAVKAVDRQRGDAEAREAEAGKMAEKSRIDTLIGQLPAPAAARIDKLAMDRLNANPILRDSVRKHGLTQATTSQLVQLRREIYLECKEQWD